ncbi:uncharacterized protein Z518_03119 [Rhinocladiella mackenziei CBS 650.93]|uniref:Rhinocladiella mackenziei CBS 650.93 unplaced genomic scaffold supercont1.2, whole genome shotgun sequence n=1 Tax=Rhinocladiella mackenziei CBS 650.93 TaxID=1442369 RepID=A0A0D2HDA6_9EURO|nr:uncharacterized protein Z518_03119 [Rhinocladiella mackenziei CBS 650.93]KIX08463.1 hypothetical protein Z518_03119 [Rhinocladiella mackenziei CBS 650.93]
MDSLQDAEPAQEQLPRSSAEVTPKGTRPSSQKKRPKGSQKEPFQFLPYNAPERKSNLHLAIVKPLYPKEINDGFIYMLQRPDDPNFVKIGYTTETPEDRLRSWKRSCKLEYTLKYSSHHTPCAKRVESLIHVDLGKVRYRESSCKSNSPCKKQHYEWFKISPEKARNVIDYWVNWMTKVKPYQGEKLRPECVRWTFLDFHTGIKIETVSRENIGLFLTDSNGDTWVDHDQCLHLISEKDETGTDTPENGSETAELRNAHRGEEGLQDESLDDSVVQHDVEMADQPDIETPSLESQSTPTTATPEDLQGAPSLDSDFGNARRQLFPSAHGKHKGISPSPTRSNAPSAEGSSTLTSKTSPSSGTGKYDDPPTPSERARCRKERPGSRGVTDRASNPSSRRPSTPRESSASKAQLRRGKENENNPLEVDDRSRRRRSQAREPSASTGTRHVLQDANQATPSDSRSSTCAGRSGSDKLSSRRARSSTTSEWKAESKTSGAVSNSDDEDIDTAVTPDDEATSDRDRFPGQSYDSRHESEEEQKQTSPTMKQRSSSALEKNIKADFQLSPSTARSANSPASTSRPTSPACRTVLEPQHHIFEPGDLTLGSDPSIPSSPTATKPSRRQLSISAAVAESPNSQPPTSTPIPSRCTRGKIQNDLTPRSSGKKVAVENAVTRSAEARRVTVATPGPVDEGRVSAPASVSISGDMKVMTKAKNGKGKRPLKKSADLDPGTGAAGGGKGSGGKEDPILILD